MFGPALGVTWSEKSSVTGFTMEQGPEKAWIFFFFFFFPWPQILKYSRSTLIFSVQCSQVLGTVCHNKQVPQVITQIRLPAFCSESLADGLITVRLFCLKAHACIFQTDPQLLAGESWCLWALFSFLQTSSSLVIAKYFQAIFTIGWCHL